MPQKTRNVSRAGTLPRFAPGGPPASCAWVLIHLCHKNKKDLPCKSFLFLVETVGIEPMTSCMSSMRSNQLSYASATCDIIPYLM